MWFLGLVAVITGLAMFSGMRRAAQAGGGEASFPRKLAMVVTAVALVLIGIGMILE